MIVETDDARTLFSVLKNYSSESWGDDFSEEADREINVHLSPEGGYDPRNPEGVEDEDSADGEK